MSQSTVTRTGATIKQIERQRKKVAFAYFAAVIFLIFIPVFIYVDIGINSLSILIYLFCLVGAAYAAERGKKFWRAAQRAYQGREGEQKVNLSLKELEEDDWEVIYNIPLSLWGDADVFLRSPSGDYFVIDLKHNNGIVFFDGSMLKLRYGIDVFPFANNRDILATVKGQAAALKELQGVRYVTPIVCFTKAILEIYAENNLIQNVYVIHADYLLETLKKIG
jgi:hypothetical protein